MKRLLGRLGSAFRREDGTATIEFVLCVPLIMTIFMASAEGGLFMTREVMLERSVDMTMRDLRLGNYPEPSPELLKREICSYGVILNDCIDNILVELQPISTVSWTMPNIPVECINRDEEIDPVVTFENSTDKEVMLVRVCLIMDPIFPSTGLGLSLKRAGGGYALVSVSAFVNEPST